MPRNNGETRKYARKIEAMERREKATACGLTVAQREADRGYPAKLNAEKANA